MSGSTESQDRSIEPRQPVEPRHTVEPRPPIEARPPIELKVEYERLNAFFADYTKNISRGGTFIQTRRPLPVGTEFLFLLFVPTLDRPLEIRGQVMSVVAPGHETEATDGAPVGMAISFVYDSDEERRQVEQMVERLMVDSLGHMVYRKLMAYGRDPG